MVPVYMRTIAVYISRVMGEPCLGLSIITLSPLNKKQSVRKVREKLNSIDRQQKIRKIR